MIYPKKRIKNITLFGKLLELITGFKTVDLSKKKELKITFRLNHLN